MLVDNLVKIGRSRRNALSVSVIAIAAYAMCDRVIMPHTASLFWPKAYASAVDARAKKTEGIASGIELKRKKLAELREQSAHLLSMLFTPDAAREFLSDLEVISVQTGCAVHSINLLGSDRKDEHEKLGIRIKRAEMSVVGLYRDVANLIRRLQDRPQKVWLDSVALQTIDYSSAKVGCSLKMTICETIDKDTL